MLASLLALMGMLGGLAALASEMPALLAVPLSVLSLGWEPGEDGAGRILVTLAGDGVLAVEVEALEVLLQDVTKPYLAPSRKAPHHPE